MTKKNNLISNPNYSMTKTKINKKLSSNKFKRFINDVSYYKSIISPKYKEYFDVVTSLYMNRQIEKKSEVEKLLNKLSSRGLGPKSAVDLIESKYMKQEPIKGIKEKLKTYHIAANIEQRMIFKNAYDKSYKKTQLDKPHLQEKLNLIKETEIRLLKLRIYKKHKKILMRI